MTLRVRRVVAGQAQGESSFLDDGPPPTVIEIDPKTGMGGAILWSTGPAPQIGIDVDVSVDQHPGFMPSPGETRFMMVCFGPGAVAHMHATETIDNFVLIEGEIELQVDQGPPTTIRAGDVVICLGANHQWVNKTDKIVRGVTTLIGATRV